MAAAKDSSSKWTNAMLTSLYSPFKTFTQPFDDMDVRLCANVLGSRLPPRNLRILDVGAGDGSTSLSFLRNISEHRRIISYTAIDISPHHTKALKNLSASFLQHADHIRIQLADIARYRPSGAFDAIVSFHSWYWIPFGQLVRYLSFLRSGGLLCLLLTRQTSISNDVISRFRGSSLSSDSVKKWLSEHHIPFSSQFCSRPVLGRNDFFLNGKMRKQAEPFFRYILRRPVEPLDDVAAYLSKKPLSYFRQKPTELILIPAPSSPPASLSR